MKWILISINILLFFQIGFSQESDDKIRFIAGFPDFIYRPVNQGEVYISALLKLEGDSLISEEILSDSLQYLFFLRSYPLKNCVICLVGNKQKFYDLADFKDYSFVIYDNKNKIKKNVSIPNQFNLDGLSYKLNPQNFSSYFNKNGVNFLLTYSNLELPKNSTRSRIIYCALNPMTGDIQKVDPEIYRDVISDGNSFILKNNNEGLLLHGDVGRNTLKIPADERFYKKLTYIDKLPDDVNIKTNYYAGKVLINNEEVLVLYLYEKEKQSQWNKLKLRVLDKQNNIWSNFTIETSIVNIKSFERWLGGNSMVKEVYKKNEDDNITFKKEDWIKKKTQYGPLYLSLIDTDESYKFYSRGSLYLRNIDSKAIIAWETGQGDSEILLVQDEMVYYRVNDKIYRVPIINGEKLGESELLVQDERVPDIHWAFLVGE